MYSSPILIIPPQVTVDPLTLQTMEPMGNASVSQDALGNTTIIYEQGLDSIWCYMNDLTQYSKRTICVLISNFILLVVGQSSDLSAQNALDLLLNMSNARELVGNSLQVLRSGGCLFILNM